MTSDVLINNNKNESQSDIITSQNEMKINFLLHWVYRNKALKVEITIFFLNSLI